ncbi:MAG: ATP-binding protein, partial [Pseudomonadota bacterium]
MAFALRPGFVVATLVVSASLCAGLLAALSGLQHKRHHAETELTAAHSEFQLALSTMSLRMTSMARALERSPAITPDIYSRIYNDAANAGLRVHERALALMPEFENAEQIQDFANRLSPQFERTGYPPFSFSTEQDAQANFPALFVEPPESRPNVFGYNMGSSPERLTAAREALRTRVMNASVPVVLSQDDGEKPSSFLLLYPVDLADAKGTGESWPALLGAGLTPASLFQDHISTDQGYLLNIKVQIAGSYMPVTLGNIPFSWWPQFALIRDRVTPDLVVNGLEVSLSSSVFYTPRTLQMMMPLSVALLTGFVLSLLAKNLSARATYRRSLEDALQAKEEELNEAHRVNAVSQRVEALGRLVGGVAHDFNNILSVILGNLELIRDKNTKDDPDTLVNEAIAAINRGAHLTRQLLTVGQKSPLQSRVLRVSDALSASADMLRRVLPETMEVTLGPNNEFAKVEVDPDGLQNAFLNIALNARDAMEGRGRLIFKSSVVHLMEPVSDVAQPHDLPPGEYVKISVTDTGPGMEPDIMDHVFEPFFTTKHATEGSGLGLASVLGFCQQSGGTCRIKSKPGSGTTLNLYFPASASEPHVQEIEPQEHGVPPSSSARQILLAEDEDRVARVLILQLEAEGHTVKRVNTGDAAWSYFPVRASSDQA